MLDLVRQRRNCTDCLAEHPQEDLATQEAGSLMVLAGASSEVLAAWGAKGGVSTPLLCMRHCVDACGTEQYRIACQSCKGGRNLANYGRDVGQVVAVLANKIE